MPMLSSAEVEVAADALVAAFAATDTDAYFACFASDATFVFHTEAERLEDRLAYERVWAGWLASGWRVEACQSSGRKVQLLGDTAVLSHEVRTVTSLRGDESTVEERETIVFRRTTDGELLAVHEHLSPAVPA